MFQNCTFFWATPTRGQVSETLKFGSVGNALSQMSKKKLDDVGN